MRIEMKAKNDQRTIVCHKDPEKHYFVSVCETIFRTSKLRPWCRTCRHFTAESKTDVKEASTSERIQNED
jgi:hypothetical protein